MNNILITGGAGNIGSALANALAKRENNFVIIADNLSTGSFKKLVDIENLIFKEIDVNNYQGIKNIFQEYNIDYVFHFAAVVGVQRTLNNPIDVLNDIKGIENLLSLCHKHGIKRFYYSSSSEVYGEPVEIPMNELTTPLNSRLPYAIVKNLGEAYCRSYYQVYNLPYTIFRFFNTYGPQQSEDFVIPLFIRKALINDDITIYGDGSQTRTFCYIDDNIETCIKIYDNGLIKNDVINIGSDIEITILELAKIIIKTSESSSKIVFKEALKEGDMTRRNPDITKMKEIILHKLIPIEEGIRNLIAYYQNDY